jgi:PIN domain nuclease of toxin-antitoxin system
MIAGVADTHAGLWYVFGDPQLSPAAKTAFEAAATARRKIALSAISLAEIVYLVEKGRLAPSAYAELLRALHDPNHVLQEAPLTSEIVGAMRRVPRVAATAVSGHRRFTPSGRPCRGVVAMRLAGRHRGPVAIARRSRPPR